MDVSELRSGDGLFSFDDGLVIRSWNEAAERLVGVSADDAVGRPCWDVLGATDSDGALVCHPGCPYARLVREGWDVPAHEQLVTSASGARRITLSTITLPTEPRLFVHLMRPSGARSGTVSSSRAGPLTPRQADVLALLADGLTAKAAAEQLGIAVSTVRNHIRQILHVFDAHSQLEALARARREGVLER